MRGFKGQKMYTAQFHIIVIATIDRVEHLYSEWNEVSMWLIRKSHSADICWAQFLRTVPWCDRIDRTPAWGQMIRHVRACQEEATTHK